MKNSLRYLKLWQKKRNELHTDADPQGDWLQMQTLLDQHMPVAKPSGGANHLPAKGFKLLSMLLTGLTAAAMTCAIWYAVKTKHRKQATTVNVTRITKFNNDSVLVTFGANPAAPGTRNADSLAATAGTTGVSAAAINDSAVAESGNAAANKYAGPANKKGSLPAENHSATRRPSVTPTVATTTGDGAKPGSNRSPTSPSASIVDKNIPVGGKTQSSTPGVTHLTNTTLGVGHSNGAVSGPLKGFLNKSGKRNRQTAGTNSSTSHSITDRNGSQLHSETNSHRIVDHANVKDGANARPLNNRDNYNDRQYADFIQATPPTPGFNLRANNPFAIDGPGISNKIIQLPQPGPTQGNKKDSKAKTKDSKPSTPSNLDWGLLAGFNSAGSFTPKAQNSNFYGSLPVDPFVGLFATYNLSDKWAVGTQLRVLNPQKITGSYTQANGSKVDSGQIIRVTDSRKAYTVDIPLHLVYKINSNLSIRGGPVFSIPVKQLKGSTNLQPAGIRADSAYYASSIAQLDSTKYQPKFNYGISAGVSYQANRFIFGVEYLKNLSGYQVNSPLGNYKSHNGTLQITIGFRLKK